MKRNVRSRLDVDDIYIIYRLVFFLFRFGLEIKSTYNTTTTTTTTTTGCLLHRWS